MQSAIVIPARYGSSRFPGKPLAQISDIAMLERTWHIAQEAKPDLLLIATDDDRIETAARNFGRAD
jgi:3-deoxy-manno-octulosonate cytidylyltransferase (CMP-KDO synthetase)